MISIDSDVLRSLTASANATLSEVSSGVEKLNNVVIHDDWNCTERDTINDKITQAKKRISRLSVNTQTFLDLICKSAEMFDTADTNVTKAFEDVHDSISDFFAIKSPIVHTEVKTTTLEVKDSVYSGAKSIDMLTGYSLNNLVTPIKICRYDDLDFGKTDW